MWCTLAPSDEYHWTVHVQRMAMQPFRQITLTTLHHVHMQKFSFHEFKFQKKQNMWQRINVTAVLTPKHRQYWIQNQIQITKYIAIGYVLCITYLQIIYWMMHLMACIDLQYCHNQVRLMRWVPVFSQTEDVGRLSDKSWVTCWWMNTRHRSDGHECYHR